MGKIYKVIKVINSIEIVINAGNEKIKQFDKFLVYSLDEELFDPDTNESLGQLETVKGTVKPLHIQEKLTTLQSDTLETIREESKKIIRSKDNSGKSTTLSASLALFGHSNSNKDETEELIVPAKKEKKRLENVKVGDFVKKI